MHDGEFMGIEKDKGTQRKDDKVRDVVIEALREDTTLVNPKWGINSEANRYRIELTRLAQEYARNSDSIKKLDCDNALIGKEIKDIIKKYGDELGVDGDMMKSVIRLADYYLGVYTQLRISRGDPGRNRDMQLKTQEENTDDMLAQIEKETGQKIERRRILDVVYIVNQIENRLKAEPADLGSKEHEMFEAFADAVKSIIESGKLERSEELRVYRNRKGGQ